MKVRGLHRGLYRLAGRHNRQKTYDHPEVQRRHEALERFRELNQSYGIPVREAAALLGVSLSTLYRWRARYQAKGLRGLRPRSRRPRRCPRKRWAPELSRLPFPVHAIQVDGGGEFCAEFEAACQARQIPLIVLPPYSPKLNTRVEYVHGTCRREFYECTEMAADLEGVRRQWAGWEEIYNRVRPHESLGLKTPIQYIRSRSSSRACSQLSWACA